MDGEAYLCGLEMSDLLNQSNAHSLEKELVWFNAVLDARIALYFEHESEEEVESSLAQSIYDIAAPNLSDDASLYSDLVRELSLSIDERLIFLMALIPHIRPDLLDILFTRNKNFDRGFTQFGGLKGKNHGGFLPTCETAVFLLAGSDLNKRFEITRCFEGESSLVSKGIVLLEHSASDEPFMSAALRVSTEYLNKVTTGLYHKPDYNMNFPAKLITTKLTWEDLILPTEVMMEIQNIVTWVKHSNTIMKDWGLEKVIKPGYRSLFYGPPGTGKTLTASLIGSSVDADVYRIDLSMVVSKYIGETEKNLANVFDQAESKKLDLIFR